MARDFKTIEEVDKVIKEYKEIIDELIKLNTRLYNLDNGLSLKGHIDLVEKDLKYCVVYKYKMENDIDW